MQTILVVEDSATQAEKLRSMLEDNGIDALVAKDALAALAVINETPVDLVISDIVMPGMSGYELCQKIKAHPENRKIPVVLLSHLNEPMDIIRGLECGADNFLTKPYNSEKLIARIRTLLANRSLRSDGGMFGIRVVFAGKYHTITSEKEQILDLLMSTFEDTVQANAELQRHRTELLTAKAQLEEYASLLEGRVRVSEQQYALLMANANSAIFVAHVDGRIIEANLEAGKLLGTPPNEVADRRISEFVQLENDQSFEPLWKQMVSTGSLHQRNGVVRRPDGGRLWVDIACSRVRAADADFVHVILHDVTERIRLQEELDRAGRMRYALIAESTREILLFIDRSTGQIIEANAAACAAYGYSGAEMKRLTLEDIQPAQERAETASRFELADDGTIFETIAVRNDGSTFPVEVVLRSGKLDGRKVILSVGRDITERTNISRELSRALEEAVRVGQLKSQFVATVSHELRTPMNGIIGMAELLLHGELSRDEQSCAQTIYDSSQALLKIINDILDFSKLEAGRTELEIVDFALPPLVESVVQLVNRAFNRDPVMLLAYVNPSVPATVRGDPGRIRQVLTNLLSNAVKFTEAGSVLLNVDVEAGRHGRNLLKVTIADTGIGMSAEAQARLFQPFTQGDASITRRFGGTGLGLMICKAYVELMGGEIGIHSVLGEGTTVSFSVPLETPEKAGVQPELPSIDGVRALIVENDETARTALERYAADLGMEAQAAEDAAAALDALRSRAKTGSMFDIAIVGSVSPHGEDERAFANAVKRDALLSATKLVRIVNDSVAMSAQVPGGPYDAYIAKPILQAHVYGCLTTLLAESAREPAAPCAPHVTGRISSKTLSVLVAEDNAINRLVAERQLKMLGCEPTFAEDGQAAVECAGLGHFDAVLMDCNMPIADGFTATMEIRAQERRSARTPVPIVAMTASASDEDRARCLAAGMDDYISKPIHLADLRAVLLRVLPADAAPAR